MNICDQQLYLSLVSKLFVIIFLIFPIQSSAEWIKSEGSEYIDRKTTIDDSCKNARMKAKRNALSKASLERIQSNQIQICSENKLSSDCKLFESTFDYIVIGLAIIGFGLLLFNPSFVGDVFINIILVVVLITFVFRLFQLIKLRQFGLLFVVMIIGIILMAYFLYDKI